MTGYGINADGVFPIPRGDKEPEEHARELWAAADAWTRKSVELADKAARIREEVVTDLQSRGLGFRRIAQVLGVTHHQQIDQIARRAKRRESGSGPHRAGATEGPPSP